MRVQDLKIGNDYRHKQNPNYGWARVVKVLKGKEAENTNSYAVAKCEWTTDRGGLVGVIKYFKPSDLIAAPERGVMTATSAFHQYQKQLRKSGYLIRHQTGCKELGNHTPINDCMCDCYEMFIFKAGYNAARGTAQELPDDT